MPSEVLRNPITFAGLATTALGLSAALAWNDAVKKVIAAVVKTPRESATTAVLYAIVVTILIIVVVVAINKTATVVTQVRNGATDFFAPRLSKGRYSSARKPA